MPKKKEIKPKMDGQPTPKGRFIDEGWKTADELGLTGMSMVIVSPMRKPSKDVPVSAPVPTDDEPAG